MLRRRHVLAHVRRIPGLVTADWRRRPVPPEASVPGTAWRRFLLAGTIRFLIEFVRVNTRLVGPLTLAHMISLGLALVGVAMLVSSVKVMLLLALLPAVSVSVTTTVCAPSAVGAI